MRHGDRRPASRTGDPDGLLARFEPAPGRTARVVLHPRLTVLPVPADDLDGLRTTFEVAVPVRVLTAADVLTLASDTRSRAERAAAYDDAIAVTVDARRDCDEADVQVAAALELLQTARDAADRVSAQQARAEATIAAARERLALLEGVQRSEPELRRDLEDARVQAAAAQRELDRLGASAPPDVATAEAALATAEAELERVVTAGRAGVDPVDGTAHRLELWAAQRAVSEARAELERARHAEETGEHPRVAVVRRRLEDARERIVGLEMALDERIRGERRETTEAPAEARALRAQIAAVERTLERSRRERAAQTAAAKAAVEEARRRVAAAQRRLAAAVDRLEPGAGIDETDAVLARARNRRALLDGADPEAGGGTAALLHLLAEVAEPVLLLVDAFPDPPDDLLEALVSVSALKRVVLATDKTSVLHDARALDPDVGAVRTPIDIGGPRPALATSDGNRS